MDSSIEEMAPVIEQFQTRIDGGADTQKDLDDFLEHSHSQAQKRIDSIPLLESSERRRWQDAFSSVTNKRNARREE